MPTGYTDRIGKNVSFEDFALNCARAFGHLIMMRDEPSDAKIPDVIEPDNYHLDKIKEANKKLKQLEKMSVEQCKKKMDKENKEEITRVNKWNQDKKTLKTKYESMLEKVKLWIPPTKDHQGLKDFMVQQITDSIKWDCELYTPDISMLTPANWKKSQIQSCKEDIEYHIKHHDEEVQRCKERTIWIQELKKSFGLKLTTK